MSTTDVVNDVESALTIASTVAGALAPPWDAVGVGLDVINEILSLFFPSDSSTYTGPTLQQIVSAFSNEMTIAQIKAAHDAIATTASTFVSMATADVPLPKSVNEALTTDPDGVFATLYNFLHNAVTGIDQGALLQPINQMMTAQAGDICTADTNPQAAYLPTLAFGVSTYVLLTTYWVSLACTVDGPSATSRMSLNEAINELSTTSYYGQAGMIGYVQAATSSFLQQVNNRLGQISVQIPYSFYDTDGPFPWSWAYAAYFADTGEAVQGFNPDPLPQQQGLPSWPGTQAEDTMVSECPAGAVYAADMGDNNPAVLAQVGQLRNAYVDLMRQTIYNNYFDAGQMQSIVDNWGVALTRLKQANQGTAGAGASGGSGATGSATA